MGEIKSANEAKEQLKEEKKIMEENHSTLTEELKKSNEHVQQLTDETNAREKENTELIEKLEEKEREYRKRNEEMKRDMARLFDMKKESYEIMNKYSLLKQDDTIDKEENKKENT